MDRRARRCVDRSVPSTSAKSVPRSSINRCSEPICELELELKQARGEGGAAALIDLALDLLDVGGKSPPALTPVARSKAERGYQLAAQRPAPAVKASAKAFVENITNRSTTASALRAVVAHGLAVLTANIDVCCATTIPSMSTRHALRCDACVPRSGYLIANNTMCRGR